MNTLEVGLPPTPASLHVQEVVRSAEQELRKLLEVRADASKQINSIRQILAGLANMFGATVLSPELLNLVERGTTRKQPGFTRACRIVLMEAQTPLDARAACQELSRRFPQLVERHKKPLASVTTVFNRLVAYQEASVSVADNGRRVWEWAATPGMGRNTALRLAMAPSVDGNIAREM